jgi:hypothetical protein
MHIFHKWPRYWKTFVGGDSQYKDCTYCNARKIRHPWTN